MRSIRSASILGLLLCLPHFIYVWGMLSDTSASLQAAETIRNSLKWFWLFQITAIVLSVPEFLRSNSVATCIVAHAALIYASLPFIALAWLAGGLNLSTLLSVSSAFCASSIVTIGLVLPFARLSRLKRMPVELDKAFCLIVVALIWSYRQPWLA